MREVKIMSNYIQVITTVGEKRYAKQIAEELILDNLAACVQIIDTIKSTYRWKGNIERAVESLCLIKSVESKYEDIEKRIKHIHPYENPEIISVPIVNGSKEYLNWIEEEVE